MTTEAKELVVVRSDECSVLYKIKFAGGGQLPEQLKGQYTSPTDAEIAIKQYKKVQPKPKRRQRKDNGAD